MQVVTVGVVGGSDLAKISEQLGKTGQLLLILAPLTRSAQLVVRHPK